MEMPKQSITAQEVVEDMILGGSVKATQSIVDNNNLFWSVDCSSERLQRMLVTLNASYRTPRGLTIRWLWPPLSAIPLLPIMV